MGDTTAIEWADHTFNPWMGCHKIARGCLHCYAADNYAVRMKGVKWGLDGTRRVVSESMWAQPMMWCRAAIRARRRARVFSASLADVFEAWRGVMIGPDGQQSLRSMDDYRCRLFGLIDETAWHRAESRNPKSKTRTSSASGSHIGHASFGSRNSDLGSAPSASGGGGGGLDWLLLTKRPAQALEFLKRTQCDGSIPILRRNLWIGVSVSDQREYQAMLPLLWLLRPWAMVLFVSMEPLVERIDPGPRPGFDWAILGGESGRQAESTDLDALAWTLERLRRVEVPTYVKQIGARPMRDGKAHVITDPKGGDMSEWPAVLRVREFPRVEW